MKNDLVQSVEVQNTQGVASDIFDRFIVLNGWALPRLRSRPTI